MSQLKINIDEKQTKLTRNSVLGFFGYNRKYHWKALIYFNCVAILFHGGNGDVVDFIIYFIIFWFSHSVGKCLLVHYTLFVSFSFPETLKLFVCLYQVSSILSIKLFTAFARCSDWFKDFRNNKLDWMIKMFIDLVSTTSGDFLLDLEWSFSHKIVFLKLQLHKLN